MLRHGIASPTYWETGEHDRDFKWNNYLNRFHVRHVDLMDVLAAYQGRGRASLEHVSLLLGLPGKLGMGGDQVFEYWKAGRLAEIRAYCETDVLNTYLVWLRFELARGQLSAQRARAGDRARARLARARATIRTGASTTPPGPPLEAGRRRRNGRDRVAGPGRPRRRRTSTARPCSSTGRCPASW